MHIRTIVTFVCSVLLATSLHAQTPAPEAAPAPAPAPPRPERPARSERPSIVLPPNANAPLPALPPLQIDREKLADFARAQADLARAQIDLGSREQGDLVYDQAREAIERGQFERALSGFNRVIEMKAAKADAAFYWKAYTEDRLGDRAKALTTLADLKKQFTNSRWIKDANALEVELRQATGQVVPADLQNNEELKLLALRGLMQNDPDQAMPIIERLMNGSDTPRVKERALFVLSQSRTPRARDIIVNAAKAGSNPDLQLKAISYLGMMNQQENGQVLQDIYKSSNDPAVKRAVIRSLMMRPRERDGAQPASAARAGASLADLYQMETSPELRKSIIGAMAAQRDAAGLVTLARAEKNPEMKREIVSRLSMIKTKEATDYLLELLK